ncbi:hypothetical protein Bca101_021567 [Brassica carinata]
MSSPHKNTNSSSSTPKSSLPDGATTKANNVNREEKAMTSTQQPNSVVDRSFISETDRYRCGSCGKIFERYDTLQLHERGDCPYRDRI